MKFFSIILGIATFALLCASIVLFVIYPVPMVVNGFWAATGGMALLWAFLTRKSIWRFLTMKSTRYGANVAFIVVLVLGILGLVNFAAKNYSWRKDITRSAVNSLSPQTFKVLGSLPEPVKAYYFGTVQDKDKNEPLLKTYAHESKNFQYEFVDISRRPTFAKSMGVDKTETLVLKVGETNKQAKVQGISEEKVTNGLIKLLRTKEQVVYFVSGHGERSIVNAEDQMSYTRAKEELEKQGYTPKELNLFSEGKIPADAAVLVIAGPTQGFFPKELDVLSAWIKDGGRALLAVDISPQENGLARGSRQLGEILKNYGVRLPNEMLVDPTSRAAAMEPQILLGFSGSRDHPITKDFAMSAVAANFLFPLTTYLDVEEVPGFPAALLARTSPNAWAEGDWKSLRAGSASFQPGQDQKGQMALAVAIETQGTKVEGLRKVRLAVFGSSTFATNNLIDKVSNRDLFLNSVAWLADDEQFISIRAKDEGEGLKQFNNNVLNLVLLLSVFVVPTLLALLGIVVWLRRSKL
jgi:ABC-type uncharacterized transport system involved in gliding motility auxiliary subunit